MKLVHHVAHGRFHDQREHAGTDVGDGNDDFGPPAKLAEALNVGFMFWLEFWLIAMIVVSGSWVA